MKRFLWHYVEMIIAMGVGMLVLGAARAGLFALLDVDLSSGTQPELAALLMAFDMSVGMVVWMRYRGHGWASSMEMVGAMFAPVVLLAPFTLAGLMSGHALMMVMHIAMLPLMFAVMLRRRAEYSRGHKEHTRAGSACGHEEQARASSARGHTERAHEGHTDHAPAEVAR